MIIISPLVLLLAVGIGSLPEAIRSWRKQTNKESLIADWFHPREKDTGKRGTAVITDSVASLPPEISARGSVFVIPLTLIMPDGEYQDGVDINPSSYYRRLREEQIHPKTSAPSPGKYLNLFNTIAKDHDVAIVLTPPKELTQTWDSARLAGEQAPQSLDVHVIDTLVAGPAQGFVVMATVRTVRSGADLETVLEKILDTQQNVGLIGVPDTMNFLAESGRVKELSGWVRDKIRIFPVITLDNGKIRIVSLRKTKKKAVNRMIQWLRKNLPKGEIALAYFHTDALKEASALHDIIESLLEPTESYIIELTPVIGAHAGPGIVGVAWWKYPIAPKR